MPSSALTPEKAWDITCSLTRLVGRDRVRLAAPTEGGWANSYPTQHRVAGRRPAEGRPWAVYLASEAGYRALGFDLDAHKAPTVAEDAVELRRLLAEVGINDVVECASGPGGGRHLWVTSADAVPAEAVRQLAIALSHRLPSLDPAPLLNPRTGALRPPGAPHRVAGASTVLSGSVRGLLSPVARSQQLEELLHRLGSSAPRTSAIALARTAQEADGTPRLVGERRPLPAGARRALETAPRPHEDASAALWSTALGLARARHSYADFRSLLDAPGMLHARTQRTPAGRVPRTAQETERLLRRQWAKAVAHVAASPAQDDGDEEFLRRLREVVALVTHAQQRAAASPGRWSHGGGPCDERILTALCVLVLQAVRGAVEADVRRLGLLAGVSRETARTALLRLAEDGWVKQVAPATGVRAAKWALVEPGALLSTGDATDALSQGDPRPLRAAYLHRFTQRLHLLSHDLFTPAGLGHEVARTHLYLTTELPTPHAGQLEFLSEACDRLGYSSATVAKHVAVLEAEGWSRRSRRDPAAWLDAAAARLGVAGVLEERQARYNIERDAWAWWCAEVAWMRAPRAAKPSRRRWDPSQRVLPMPGLPVWEQLGPHPRDRRHRADYAEAARVLRELRTEEKQSAA